ncbi:MAG TPA: helix-turn-helix domain-containing protein [Acidobacteriota bacterium]|nr:helix-turn-helix domain-containing protein [Acidobacteriota bacterium]
MKLKEFGLTNNEEKVYVALLNIGSCGASVITRKCGLHRRTVYDTLETLIEKGLVKYIVENNNKIFSPANPQVLLEKLDRIKESSQPVISDLSQLFMTIRERETTLFYRGISGIKNLLQEQLKCKEVYLLGATTFAIDKLKHFFHWYEVDRIRKGVTIKILTNEKNFPKSKLSQVKHLDLPPAPLTINIYGKTTALIYWSDNPFAIVIQSKEIAQAYVAYFELLWKTAKR